MPETGVPLADNQFPGSTQSIFMSPLRKHLEDIEFEPRVDYQPSEFHAAMDLLREAEAACWKAGLVSIPDPNISERSSSTDVVEDLIMKDVTVTINFPALYQLVTYLEAQQQSQVDALTAKVAELTASLTKATSGLQGSVDANKP